MVDDFRRCTGATIKHKLKELKTDLAIIPGGLTRFLQPLDVGINTVIF